MRLILLAGLCDNRATRRSDMIDMSRDLRTYRHASLPGLDDRIAAGGSAGADEPFPPHHRYRRVERVPPGGRGPPDIALGGVRLGFAKLAVRCATVLVDQDTGRKAAPEPRHTLAGYRRRDLEGGGVDLRATFAVLRPGALAVGDEVVVSTWSAEGRRSD
jgi:hypothetical protein